MPTYLVCYHSVYFYLEQHQCQFKVKYPLSFSYLPFSAMKMPPSVTRACTWVYPAVKKTSTAAPTCRLTCLFREAPKKPSGSSQYFAPPNSHKMVILQFACSSLYCTNNIFLTNEMNFILFSVELLALLNWKAHPDRVLDILGRLRQISGEEIIKVGITGLSNYNLLIINLHKIFRLNAMKFPPYSSWCDTSIFMLL